MNSVILAITGGSGAIYAVRLLQVLLACEKEVHLSISTSGRAVLEQELGAQIDLRRFELASLLVPRTGKPRDADCEALLEAVTGAAAEMRVKLCEQAPGQVIYHHYEDFLAPIASGSFLTGGMVICPCSGSTLSAIAHATAGNLIQRAAEVQLKERRKLVLVPRETPLSTIQLENMHRASQAGAVVLPAMPGWYHGVRGLRDIVDFVVARICDQLGIENSLMHRWGT